jgi:hypothetical protein
VPDLPRDVVWRISPEQMLRSTQAATTLPDAALAFFEGMAQQNWDRVLTVLPQSSVSEELKKGYGGLQVISVGQPFKSGLYRGWFIRYECGFPTVT